MKQVAGVLNLATRTVAFHKYRIMEMLRLSNDAELVQFAVKNHVLFVNADKDAQSPAKPEVVHVRGRGVKSGVTRAQAA
jgi:hypothetical protein